MIYRLLFVCILGFGVFAASSSLVYAQFDPFGDELDDPNAISTEGSPFGDSDDFSEPQQPVVNTPSTPTPTVVGLPKLNLSPKDVPEPHTELSTDESLSLLDKAEAALADDNEPITPMEMIRSASLLFSHGNERITLQSVRILLRKFNAADVSDHELFDIADQMGGAALAGLITNPGLGQDAGKAVDKILAGYHNHLRRRGTAESVILWKDLKTPKELMIAASGLAQVGRVEVAGVMLKRFLDTEATAQELVDIGDELGGTNILRIMHMKELEPQGRLAAQRLIDAKSEIREAESKNTDPAKQLQSDLAKLDSLDPKIHNKAITNVWQGSDNSVSQLIQQLAKSDDTAEIGKIESLLRSMKSDALCALNVSLESNDPQLVLRAAKILYSYIPAENVFLLYPAMFNPSLSDAEKSTIADYVAKISNRRPTPQQAALQLTRISLQYINKERIPKIDAEGRCDVWQYNPQTNRAEFVSADADYGTKMIAERFAGQAYRISPKTSDVKIVYNLVTLERMVSQAGIDKPFDAASLGEVSDSLSVAELETILTQAIKRNCTGAGIAAATLLGVKGTAETVLYKPTNNRTLSPIVQAASCPNRRIRFAATETIMKLNPTRPYYGSSFVSDALYWFASAQGKRVAVIGCPKTADAMMLAGYLNENGYVTKIATTNFDVMKEAIDSPDVCIVMVDSRTSRPTVQIFGQNMRADTRTREIPIAIVSGDETVLNSPTSYTNMLSAVLPNPQDAETAAVVIESLRKTTGSNEVPDDLRLEQATKTLRWLVENQENRSRIYHVENLEQLAARAANSRNHAELGYQLLAGIRSNYSQNLLAEIASSVNVPTEKREKAAEAFSQSVKKFGVLIRGVQVQRLLDAQIRSYENDAPDSVLDTLLSTIDNRLRKT